MHILTLASMPFYTPIAHASADQPGSVQRSPVDEK